MKTFHGLASLLVLTFLVGCQAPSQETTEEESNATIVQVYDGGTVQSQGSYLLKDGTLTIHKELSALSNPNAEPSELSNASQQAADILAQDFPDENVTDDQLFNEYERVVKEARLLVTKNTVTLKGADFEKEFQRLPDNQARVKDDFGIEYSFENK